ncbi:MAG: hypothetical protein ACT4PW_01465 [Acidimicrobiia bacterium]
MVGAVIMVVVLVVVLPALFLTGGAVLSAILGSTLKSDAERSHPGSEFVELNT